MFYLLGPNNDCVLDTRGAPVTRKDIFERNAKPKTYKVAMNAHEGLAKAGLGKSGWHVVSHIELAKIWHCDVSESGEIKGFRYSGYGVPPGVEGYNVPKIAATGELGVFTIYGHDEKSFRKSQENFIAKYGGRIINSTGY